MGSIKGSQNIMGSDYGSNISEERKLRKIVWSANLVLGIFSYKIWLRILQGNVQSWRLLRYACS